MKQFQRYLWSALVLAFVLSLGSTAHATTWLIGPCSGNPELTQPYSLALALEEGLVQPGDVIQLCSGATFTGDNVIYTPDITIETVKKGETAYVNCGLDEDYENQSIVGDVGFVVLANNVTIENVSINGCTAGVVDIPGASALESLNTALPGLKTAYNQVYPAGLPAMHANINPSWKGNGKGSKKSNNCPTKDVSLCLNKDVFNANFIGVVTFDVADADIENNKFYANFAGVLMVDSFTNQVKNNVITGFNAPSPDVFFATFGITDIDGTQDLISGNTVNGGGVGIDLEALATGTTEDSLKNNTTKYNAAGIGADIVDAYFLYLPLFGAPESALNTFSSNTSKDNMAPNSEPSNTSPWGYYLTGDCLDFTVGTGTAGTANTWKSSNHCGTTEDLYGGPLP